MKKKSFFKLFFSSMILTISFGCSNPSLRPTVLTTETPLIQKSATPTEAIEFRTTKEATHPTPTSFPSITVDNAVNTMTNLLQENGQCELPCLFGLSPDLSDTTSIDATINYFHANAVETDDVSLGVNIHDTSGSVYLILQKDDENVSARISYYYQNDQLEFLTLTSETTRLSSYTIDFDAPYGIELMRYYLLPNILTVYGKPTEVWIRSFPTDPNYPEDPYPFSTVLYYKEKGFLIEYVSIRQTQEEHFVGCHPTSYVSVVAWSPQEQKPLAEIVKYISGLGINDLNVKDFQKLQDATPLNIDEFYDNFIVSGEVKCISTPKELWPEPIILP
jgi:hypothetical protein